MYTIKQAAARTGLSIPTIRMWERRYGVIDPVRSSGGYRLFDDAAIDRLTAMRILVETQGWRPGQAADHVSADDTDLAVIIGAGSPTPAGPSGPTLEPAVEREIIDTVVDSTRLMDTRALEIALDHAFATQRFETAMERIIFPALRLIGEAWATGEVDVAAEHMASETVRRRLARFFDAAGAVESDEAVVVGMPPGSNHELGAFAFAVACRRAGIAVGYLGANVPVGSWQRVARSRAVHTIVLGVVTTTDASSASAVIDALDMLDDPPTILVGGPSVRSVPESSRVGRLPDHLDDAVVVLAGTIHRPGPPSS